MLNEPGFLESFDGVPISDTFENMTVTYLVQEAVNNRSIVVTSTGSVANATSLLRHLMIPFAGSSHLYSQQLVYDTDVNSQDVKPWHRGFEDPYWSDPMETVDIGHNKGLWIELAACPLRTEMIMGALDDDDDINLAVWDGTAWGNQIELTDEAKKEVKCFDVAYESLSGDALVVARHQDDQSLRYVVWDGTSWSSMLDGPFIDADKPAVVVMESDPFSDEILVAVLSDKEDIQIFQWDGDGFNDLGVIDHIASVDNRQAMDISYEQVSGDALIVWGRIGAQPCRYRIWDGIALRPEGELPRFDKEVQILLTAADPTSDYMFVAAVDSDKNLSVAVWDGSSWIDSRELEISMREDNRQCFDVAWESSGQEALVAWSRNGTDTLMFWRWTKGTAMAGSPVEVGPNFSDTLSLVQLCPIAETDKIILLVVNESKQLYHSLWDDTFFADDPPVLLGEDMTDRQRKSFDVVQTVGGVGN